ncbi:MAG: DMT family transporter [Candidatus Lokiarchaeota archaeon]|nr:DMT family transporter [Candidatus Lokiarchaeota archaeon]
MGVFCWSFSEIVVRFLKAGPYSVGVVGPISLSFYRFFFGGLILLAILGFRKSLRGVGQIFRNSPGLLVLSSVIGLGISNMIYFLGLQLTQANVGAALYTSYTLFIGVYSIFILNERTNIPLKITGFVIGFIGTIVLLTTFDFTLLVQPDKIIGNLLLVLAGAIWGFYSVLGKKIMRRNAEIKNVDVKFTILSFFLACIPIAITLPLTSEAGDFFQHSAPEWLFIAIMALFVTAIGIYLFFMGVKLIDVSHGISFSLLKPIIATAFAFLLLGELPPVAMVVSVPLVTVAVLLINKKPKKKE